MANLCILRAEPTTRQPFTSTAHQLLTAFNAPSCLIDEGLRGVPYAIISGAFSFFFSDFVL